MNPCIIPTKPDAEIKNCERLKEKLLNMDKKYAKSKPGFWSAHTSKYKVSFSLDPVEQCSNQETICGSSSSNKQLFSGGDTAHSQESKADFSEDCNNMVKAFSKVEVTEKAAIPDSNTAEQASSNLANASTGARFKSRLSEKVQSSQKKHKNKSKNSCPPKVISSELSIKESSVKKATELDTTEKVRKNSIATASSLTEEFWENCDQEFQNELVSIFDKDFNISTLGAQAGGPLCRTCTQVSFEMTARRTLALFKQFINLKNFMNQHNIGKNYRLGRLTSCEKLPKAALPRVLCSIPTFIEPNKKANSKECISIAEREKSVPPERRIPKTAPQRQVKEAIVTIWYQERRNMITLQNQIKAFLISLHDMSTEMTVEMIDCYIHVTGKQITAVNTIRERSESIMKECIAYSNFEVAHFLLEMTFQIEIICLKVIKELEKFHEFLLQLFAEM